MASAVAELAQASSPSREKVLSAGRCHPRESSNKPRKEVCNSVTQRREGASDVALEGEFFPHAEQICLAHR
jgi:hypothetical protein